MEDTQVDHTKLKYVLYARKSSVDESRQTKSVSDQIDECLELASRLGIRIAKPYLKESRSAKSPNNRPIFSQMLQDIRKGKYDGILAWHPDRLSRNMLEGGQIIDMIDENIIKDLKFVTHHFTKDANGKMLLGMAFVLSKQYSDKLSQDVTRGVRNRFEEGKSPAPKHGYIRHENGEYIPDGKNFELICNAWEMRKKGISLREICKYLNKNGYKKEIKHSGRKITMTYQMLSNMFRDPFYYGILVQKDQKVDLREIYDFIPATDEETYKEVQELSRMRKVPLNKKKRYAFYPFKAFVHCHYCGKNMLVAPSTSSSKKKQRYLFFRCDNELCIRNSPEERAKKQNDPTKIRASTRVKVFLEFVYKFLDSGLRFTANDYKEYRKHLTNVSDKRREEINIRVHSLEGRIKSRSREIRERALSMTNFNEKSTIFKVNEARIAELEAEKEELQDELTMLKAQLTDPEEERLTLNQFLNLSKNAATVVKSANPMIKDQICRLIFLNFSLENEKVASYQLKPPFDEMLKTRKVPISRYGWT